MGTENAAIETVLGVECVEYRMPLALLAKEAAPTNLAPRAAK